MKQNKTSKYFKYAIGEIILVVIGILIALQINTWNQNRIDKIEEQEIIAKLHKDFKTNKANLAQFIVEITNETNAQIALMSLIGASREELLKYNLDSLMYESFSASEVAFADNTIKSIMQSGRLDLLKNEQVTALLYKWNTLSEIRKTRMSKLDDWINNHFIPYLLSKISFKEMDATTGGLKWSGPSQVKPDYYPLFQEVEFENYLDNSLWFHQQVFLRCQETDILIDDIIKATSSK
ncbi:DUF6090 family protein [Winogradskyella aurantia]|uniref:Uncharacterized protein n=1 Tax=Winogradskyella aurantia TaxID=1915063 RepID=A0A265URX1_9FLAO|nr:DUF6090 family protein [Winogradskyella aurantia]OZV68044.1 hypothetical protein CA834_10380 [Winogradskyella aurantia]